MEKERGQIFDHLNRKKTSWKKTVKGNETHETFFWFSDQLIQLKN